jgi:hypothetical protein
MKLTESFLQKHSSTNRWGMLTWLPQDNMKLPLEYN